MTTAGRAAWRVGSRVWHGAVAAIAALSLIAQVAMLFAGGPDADDGRGGEALGVRLLRLFSYFTVQSNVLVLAAALSLALPPDRDGRWWRVLRLDALLGIAVTGVVFGTVLAALSHPVGVAWWVNLGFHYLTPWLSVLGWLLFGPRPRVDPATAARAAIWPVLWVAHTFAHGAITGFYPYPFLDVTGIGYAAALRNTLLVLALAVALVLVAAVVDNRLRPTVR
ncbi:Pr6Pr family membrane protein [Saccharothrix algeriensis]|uniref:Pr6Pr family membrane protein n=1 Tax=Saccharothrix algeriensis TaxID=173560 RepID=A0A8T8I4G8_9PSEU|nr:Pr6Pr family membrane protein [Saccharothrix algeriensis]